MSIASKVSILAAIVIADLLFFYFFSVYYPEILEGIFEQLPWEDTFEKSIMIILGLLIAVISSATIVNVVIKHFQTTTKG